METVAGFAILLSASLAGIGVAGLVGWGSLLALAGTVALVVGTLLTEVAASRLPVHAQARAQEGGAGGVLKAALVVAGFAVLTGWNVTAGHMGMVAIDSAAVADLRAPLEKAAADANAEKKAKDAALAAFDDQTLRQERMWSDSLRGVDPSYVSVTTLRLRAAADEARERARERVGYAEAAQQASAKAEAAQAELARASHGRPDHELWGFALVLELLKGALVWFATGRERKAKASLTLIEPKAAADMTTIELREMASRGASLAATARHELNRRKAA